jgi:hypothetical protein
MYYNLFNINNFIIFIYLFYITLNFIYMYLYIEKF